MNFAQRSLPAMAMRASSVPGAMVRRAADGNPVWSDKAKGEWQLRRNWPEDLEQVLPPVPGDDDTVQQELEEVLQDRGSAAPGQGSKWRRRSRSPVRLEKFSTPASWVNHGQEGLRSSGRMPPSGGSGATSTSQATARAKEEGECSEGPWPPEDQEGIQRALEKEIVEHLHKENQRLKRCIEELKKKSEKGSWSEVSQTGMSDPLTPRQIRHGAPEEQDRYTPGGTKVPPGPPPEDDELGSRMPVWPPSLDGVQYEIHPRKNTVKACLGMEEPKMGRGALRQDGGSLSPLEARAAWLERETVALRKAMQEEQERLGHGCFYEAMLSDHEVRECDRASAVRGVREGDRASALRGVREGDRASACHGVREGDRAPAFHEVREGDRASAFHGVRECDRASAFHGVRECDRASAVHGVRESDRASADHGVPEGDRATARSGGQAGAGSELWDGPGLHQRRDLLPGGGGGGVMPGYFGNGMGSDQAGSGPKMERQLHRWTWVTG